LGETPAPSELQRALDALEETAREYKRLSSQSRRVSRELQQKVAELREKFARVGIKLA
jgi:uncharacterized protein YdeI (YjbR/CyaY-like superfamily)